MTDDPHHQATPSRVPHRHATAAIEAALDGLSLPGRLCPPCCQRCGDRLDADTRVFVTAYRPIEADRWRLGNLIEPGCRPPTLTVPTRGVTEVIARASITRDTPPRLDRPILLAHSPPTEDGSI